MFFFLPDLQPGRPFPAVPVFIRAQPFIFGIISRIDQQSAINRFYVVFTLRLLFPRFRFPESFERGEFKRKCGCWTHRSLPGIARSIRYGDCVSIFDQRNRTNTYSPRILAARLICTWLFRSQRRTEERLKGKWEKQCIIDIETRGNLAQTLSIIT